MNFREIDFHIHPGHAVNAARLRQHRFRINHIIDSIILRIPKALSTDLFCKLNVSILNVKAKYKFWHYERIGYVQYFNPDAEDLLSLPQQKSVGLVRSYLSRGVSVAAKHDSKFAAHLPIIRQLIKTAHLPFDYRTGISCLLGGEGLKAELILRIQANQYVWDVELSGNQSTGRLTLMKTPPLLPWFSGFKNLKLDWIDNRIRLTDQAGKVLAKRALKSTIR